MNFLEHEQEPGEVAENNSPQPSQDEEPRGIFTKDESESARAPIEGGMGGAGGNSQMYMGMFQMMAMPNEMPSMPSMPSMPGS